MTVFDASALLAFLRGEPGSESAAERLRAGGTCGAANWSEVAQKVRQAGADWGLARELLLSFGVRIEPVTEADAETAAALGKSGSGLSLAERLCLTPGARAGREILAMDGAWTAFPNVVLAR